MRRLVAALVVLVAAPAQGQPAPFEGTAEAPITAGDRVRARSRALDEALRQVVDAAAASLLDPAALAERQSALKLTIEPRARSYLLGYRVVDEGEVAGSFRVHVAAEVALDGLERDLRGGAAATGPRAAPPRVGVCLAPAAAEGRPAPRATAMLEAALASAGCATVSLPAACAVAGEPSSATAAPLARALGAAHLDGALIGRFVGRAGGAIRGTQLVGAHVDLGLSLVDAAGARVWSLDLPLDGYGADLPTAIDDTLAAAPAAALAGLGEAVARRWPRPVALSVRVHFERYPDLVALQRVLAAAPGVTRVEPRRFVGGSAELLVEGPSDATALAGAATRASTSAAGAPRYLARAVDPRTVDVQVIAPPPPAEGAPPGEPPQPLPTLPGASPGTR